MCHHPPEVIPASSRRPWPNRAFLGRAGSGFDEIARSLAQVSPAADDSRPSVLAQLLVAMALGASLHAVGQRASIATLLVVITLAPIIGGAVPVPRRTRPAQLGRRILLSQRSAPGVPACPGRGHYRAGRNVRHLRQRRSAVGPAGTSRPGVRRGRGRLRQQDPHHRTPPARTHSRPLTTARPAGAEMAGAIETGGAADTPYGSGQRSRDRDTASGPAGEADA